MSQTAKQRWYEFGRAGWHLGQDGTQTPACGFDTEGLCITKSDTHAIGFVCKACRDIQWQGVELDKPDEHADRDELLPIVYALIERPNVVQVTVSRTVECAGKEVRTKISVTVEPSYAT